MAHADRFRALLAHLGLSHPEAAKLLHVSLRTLQNWLSGYHAVPYTAYKLLRLMRYMELPCPSWAGWHFSQGQLVTPEGRTISGKDGAWWSLLVRQAHGFGELYRRANAQPVQRSAAVQVGLACDGTPASACDSRFSGEVPVTPHFSLTDETNQPLFLNFTFPQVSYRTPVFLQKSLPQEPRS